MHIRHRRGEERAVQRAPASRPGAAISGLGRRGGRRAVAVSTGLLTMASLALTGVVTLGPSATAGAIVITGTPGSIDSVTVPVAPVTTGTTVTASATVTDGSSVTGATWSWGDGTTTTGVVDTSTGTITGSHTYTTSGVYTVTLTVYYGSTPVTTTTTVVIYNPDSGFVTGGGWIDSPAGSLLSDPSATGKATFGFVSHYKPGATAPSGDTEFQFHAASFDFHTTSYQWLVVTGCEAQFEGTGTVNGAGSYPFVVTAIDGSLCATPTSDSFSIQVDNSDGSVLYDSTGSVSVTTPNPLQEGAIQIHS